jgi:2-dehydro-3-deoxyphosphogluconate aldolase / (4S)-4-hydroxy-2-oxoglutarate aldolase
VDISAIAALAPVVPVLTIERTADAVPLARALVKGGLPVLEITLRAEAALAALTAIAAEVPEAVVGAGTVLQPRRFDDVRRAGAGAAGLPFLPCIQTVSEAMVLAEQGFGLLKFFPADTAGGLAWLKAVAAPLAGLRFCPTGGVGADTAQTCLSLANVACVGGSWVAPRDAVAKGDWVRIERLAAAAAELKRL